MQNQTNLQDQLNTLLPAVEEATNSLVANKRNEMTTAGQELIDQVIMSRFIAMQQEVMEDLTTHAQSRLTAANDFINGEFGARTLDIQKRHQTPVESKTELFVPTETISGNFQNRLLSTESSLATSTGSDALFGDE